MTNNYNALIRQWSIYQIFFSDIQYKFLFYPDIDQNTTSHFAIIKLSFKKVDIDILPKIVFYKSINTTWEIAIGYNNERSPSLIAGFYRVF